MAKGRNPRKRAYHAPWRQAQAARTREAIVHAAKELFEQHGWTGTTVGAIAESAGVSQKTVEAVFHTKAAMLQAAVDYAIRGDVQALPISQRESVQRMEAAPDAASMLRLHALHLRTINQRSAHIAWTVEHAAASDPTVAKLWQRMNDNRTFGVQWATKTLLKKAGRKRGLTRTQTEATFWVALDWSTYRTLTQQAGLDANQYETWLRRCYKATFLPDESTS
jgi:TetR/AcrR family transcriptional regulator, regulator of autoinduction and epiphytic fitness